MSPRFLTATLALAGCATPPASAVQPPAPVPTAVATVPAPAPLAPVTSLAGEWRVAGIDGRPVEGEQGFALRADAREIWWEPRCASSAKSYRINGARFAARPPLGKPPGLICTIAPPRAIAEIFAGLDVATGIRRTENNGVEISGGGHSLLLFSQ